MKTDRQSDRLCKIGFEKWRNIKNENKPEVVHRLTNLRPMKTFRNISREVVEEWNAFIDLPDKKPCFDPCGSCAGK